MIKFHDNDTILMSWKSKSFTSNLYKLKKKERKEKKKKKKKQQQQQQQQQQTNKKKLER